MYNHEIFGVVDLMQLYQERSEISRTTYASNRAPSATIRAISHSLDAHTTLQDDSNGYERQDVSRHPDSVPFADATATITASAASANFFLVRLIARGSEVTDIPASVVSIPHVQTLCHRWTSDL